MKPYLTIMPLLAIALALTGCNPEGDNEEAAPQQNAAPPELEAVFAEVSSDTAPIAIPELRTTAAPGDEVVLEAKVMGTKQPFVENRSVFVVGDEGTLTSCDILHGDGCPTPWDNCCDHPDAIRTGTATIQVVDEGGNVLRHGVKGIAGLQELSRIRVAGVVAPNSTEAAFIVNAKRIQILQGI